ncbi:MAG: type II secretion system protein [Candidatus Omnitrophota bacterium]
MNSKLLTNKGFTLVEVFLVASLMGILLLTVFSVYTAGIRIWKTVKSVNLMRDHKFLLAQVKMRKELSGYVRDFDEEEISFEGEAEKLTFPYISSSHIVAVTYEFDGAKRVLLRKVVKYSEFLKDKMNESISELFEAQQVEFSYLFYDKVEQLGEWVTSFEQKEKGVPDAVKLTIRRNDEEIIWYLFIPK